MSARLQSPRPRYMNHHAYQTDQPYSNNMDVNHINNNINNLSILLIH